MAPDALRGSQRFQRGLDLRIGRKIDAQDAGAQLGEIARGLVERGVGGERIEGGGAGSSIALGRFRGEAEAGDQAIAGGRRGRQFLQDGLGLGGVAIARGFQRGFEACADGLRRLILAMQPVLPAGDGQHRQHGEAGDDPAIFLPEFRCLVAADFLIDLAKNIGHLTVLIPVGSPVAFSGGECEPVQRMGQGHDGRWLSDRGKIGPALAAPDPDGPFSFRPWRIP